MEDRRCRGTNTRGEPCGVKPEMVDPETGYCPAHGPGGDEHMKELARRGGQRTKQIHEQRGLNLADLPELESPEDVEVWLELTGRAVLSESISTSTAKTVSRILRDWLSAHEAGAVTRQLEQLRDALDEARDTGDFTPVLEVVQ